MLHFINNSACYFSKYFPRNLCCFCSHEVDGLYGAECYCVVVGSLIAHYANRAHVCEGCEVLVDFLVEAGVCDFFAVDGIGILDDAYFFSGYFATD